MPANPTGQCSLIRKNFNAIKSSLGELPESLEEQTSNIEGYLPVLSSSVGQASKRSPALGNFVSDLTGKLTRSIEKGDEILSEAPSLTG
jgi:hypothetical protein